MIPITFRTNRSRPLSAVDPDSPKRPFASIRREARWRPRSPNWPRCSTTRSFSRILTDAEIDRGLAVAIEYNVASVCIKPYAVKRAAKLLAGTTIAASTVIGFPHGGHLPA